MTAGPLLRAAYCRGHVTLPDRVLPCKHCGHPTDERCLRCGIADADRQDEGGLLVDASLAADVSPVCPCCRSIHDEMHEAAA
jgi:hypothetical protein